MFAKEDLSIVSNDLFLLLVSLNSRLINRSVMLRGLSVPPSHMKVLFYLIMHGSSPVSRIAKDLLISKPNMTPILDNLIAEGYAERYDDPNDRRIILIRPTKKSHDLLEEKQQESKKLLAEKLAVLGDDELEALKEMLPRITEILSKLK